MLFMIDRGEERSLLFGGRRDLREDYAGFLVPVARQEDLSQGDTRLTDDFQRAVGRFGQQLQAGLVTLGLILAVTVGEQIALHLAADRPLGPQLLGTHRGKLRHDAFQLFP